MRGLLVSSAGAAVGGSSPSLESSSSIAARFEAPAALALAFDLAAPEPDALDVAELDGAGSSSRLFDCDEELAFFGDACFWKNELSEPFFSATG